MVRVESQQQINVPKKRGGLIKFKNELRQSPGLAKGRGGKKKKATQKRANSEESPCSLLRATVSEQHQEKSTQNQQRSQGLGNYRKKKEKLSICRRFDFSRTNLQRQNLRPGVRGLGG